MDSEVVAHDSHARKSRSVAVSPRRSARVFPWRGVTGPSWEQRTVCGNQGSFFLFRIFYLQNAPFCFCLFFNEADAQCVLGAETEPVR